MSGLSLKVLEDSIREVLAYAIGADIDVETQTKLIDIFRKIRLSCLLDEEEFVSIGGTQGAGKTTFLTTLYKECGIENWLKGNNGRGEQMSVLIKQDPKSTEIRAERLVYDAVKKETVWVACEQEEFTRTIQDYKYRDNYGRGTLLTQLIVPAIHDLSFNWMLLPGYEAITRDNENWQGLMHYAICHASGMVFVADATRTAQNQDSILKSIKEIAHKVTPIIVLSRCDAIRNNPEQINELIATASKVYEVDQGQVVAAGTDYENWKDSFDNLLKNSLRSGIRTQEDKYEAVLKTVERDLQGVINEIEDWVVDQDYNTSRAERVIDKHLRKFRDAVSSYKEQLQYGLDIHFNDVAEKAINEAKACYMDEEVGLGNNMDILAKKLTFRGVEVDERREERVKNALIQANPQSAIVQSIAEASAKEMKISINSNAQNLLGYGKETDELFHENWDGVRTALKTLLYPNDGSKQVAVNAEDMQKSFDNALRLLPAMTMEYVRLSQMVSIFAGAEAGTQNAGITQESTNQLLQIFATNFNDTSTTLTGSAKVVVGSLAAVLGVDSMDGKMGDGVNIEGLSSLVGLSKVAVTRIVGGVLMAAGAALTLHQVSSHTARNDRKNLDYINEMIARNVLGQKSNALISYDRAMNQLERQIRRNLQKQYSLSNLGNEYNLMVALKQLKQARQDAVEYLNAEKVLSEQL